MDRIMVAVAIAAAVVFAAGFVLGIIAMVSWASRQEDALGSLTRRAPGAAARGARWLNGVGCRDITPRDRQDVRR